MRKIIYLKCERCNSTIRIDSPEQISNNIGRDRILCYQCYEWEKKPASF